jgi:hypothetical protein
MELFVGKTGIRDNRSSDRNPRQAIVAEMVNALLPSGGISFDQL